MSPAVTIYDQFGRPVDRSALFEEYGAPTYGGVRSIRYTPQKPTLTPEKLGSILRQAVDGDAIAQLTLDEEMEESDLHYAGVLGDRKLAITAVKPSIKAASESKLDQEIAAYCAGLLSRPEAALLINHLVDALGKGYAAVEIMWNRQTSEPSGYKRRDPRHFQFDEVTAEELRLRSPTNMYGEPLAPYKWIVHTPALKSGIPIRGGLGRLCAAAFCIKTFTIRDWLAFAEVFGMPVRVGKYGPRATAEDIAKLINAVVNLGTDAAAVIPDSMKIEFEEAVAANNGGALFLGLAEYMDKQVSKAVLHQTMTTDDGASKSQGEVHERVSGRVTDHDLRQLSVTLDMQWVRPVVDLSRFGRQKAYPSIVLLRPQSIDTTLYKEVILPMVDRGMEISAEDVRGKLGFEAPKAGHKLLSPVRSAAPTAPPAPQQEEQKPATARVIYRDEDDIDVLRRAALESWQPQMESIVGPIRELARTANDEREFLAGLERLRGTIDPTTFRDAIARALFEARINGEES